MKAFERSDQDTALKWMVDSCHRSILYWECHKKKHSDQLWKFEKDSNSNFAFSIKALAKGSSHLNSRTSNISHQVTQWAHRSCFLLRVNPRIHTKLTELTSKGYLKYWAIILIPSINFQWRIKANFVLFGSSFREQIILWTYIRSCYFERVAKEGWHTSL